MTVIVAANRDRDSYQVAAAFAEVASLETLITDYYHGADPWRLNALAHRRSPLIEPTIVQTSARALALQVGHRLANRIPRVRVAFPSRAIDDALARRAARAASASPQSDLLMYSNYAYRAFEGPSRGRRILFQYHPSASAVARGLTADSHRSTSERWEAEPELKDGYRRGIYQREIEAADYFLCASEFTATGLVDDGVSRSRIEVVPYGCPAPPSGDPDSGRQRLFLYVGQGIQRKGLHVLLRAWKIAAQRGWRLRIVASRLDPSMADLIAQVRDEGVDVSGPVDDAELQALYRTADTLVVPSLVEGFGLVLGEGLAAGCRLIATTNTGLPDLRLSSDLAATVAPGSIDELVGAMRRSMETFEHSTTYRQAARVAAAERSWQNYRAEIRAAAGRWT